MEIAILYFLIFSGAVVALASIFLVIFSSVIVALLVIQVPAVDTPKKYYSYIFSNLDIDENTMIYDLGCGDGSFLCEAVKYNPKKCIGYELSPWFFFKATLRTLLPKNKKVQIYCRNFLKEDLSEADIVYLFLVGSVVDKVGGKLKKELKKGSTIVSLGFPLSGWETFKVIDLSDKFTTSSKIYFYKV